MVLREGIGERLLMAQRLRICHADTYALAACDRIFVDRFFGSRGSRVLDPSLLLLDLSQRPSKAVVGRRRLGLRAVAVQCSHQ